MISKTRLLCFIVLCILAVYYAHAYFPFGKTINPTPQAPDVLSFGMLVIVIVLLPFKLIHWKSNRKILLSTFFIGIAVGISLIALPYILAYCTGRMHFLDYDRAFEVAFLMMRKSLLAGLFMGVIMPFLIVPAPLPQEKSIEKTKNENENGTRISEHDEIN
jgi:threonine/homoserine efflux transporter RhtA